ncbi:MAG: bifunctional diaminohydroxyphosphoribosylaminopyrimidine deaminase/5-amino-6-(5-phosphoribosylamino)uracil reductase RibD [Chitinophagaceae bacterium]
MHRCLELAKLAAGNVAPNPMVGAVLVHDDKIIGEGYHHKFGKPHAEVNCIESVQQENMPFIAASTLYVSLEPCAHFGKTPPCTDLVINQKIPHVVIGCRDPFEQVNGKGIEKLMYAGINVTTGILEEECKQLNKRFFIFHTQHRPYIILKWAQTANGKIAQDAPERLFITNVFANRLVHKWRSEAAAIFIGTNTAQHDDPSLSNRFWSGNNPVRTILDLNLRLPKTLKIFDHQQKTIIFNFIKHQQNGSIFFYQLNENENIIHQIMHAFFELNIQSVLVEGGAKLLQSFIDAELWDEARIITNENLYINNGVQIPQLFNASKYYSENFLNDRVDYFYKS